MLYSKRSHYIRELLIISFTTMIIPELAELALPAARKYASLRLLLPMPNICLRIFLHGLVFGMNVLNQIWPATSAQMLCRTIGNKGHWDEELHALGLPGLCIFAKRRQ